MRLIISFLAVIGLAAAGCGDDGEGNGNGEELGQEVEQEVEEGVEQGGARAAAEVVRVSLTARELGEDENLRDVSLLEEAIENVPGEIEVVGLEDGDGDGRDDDGQLELIVGDESACVSVPESGQSVDVHGGSCS